MSDHQVIMQCRNGGEMSEWRRREEIVIYIDCDVVVVHQCMKLKYDVNHKEYVGAFGQRQPQGHTCCNNFKNLCLLLLDCHLTNLVYCVTIFVIEVKTLSRRISN